MLGCEAASLSFSLSHSLCLLLSCLSSCNFSQIRILPLSPTLPFTFSLSLHSIFFSVSRPHLSCLSAQFIFFPLHTSLSDARFFFLVLSPTRTFSVSFFHFLTGSLLLFLHSWFLFLTPFYVLSRDLTFSLSPLPLTFSLSAHTLTFTSLHTFNFSLPPHSLSLSDSQNLKQREFEPDRSFAEQHGSQDWVGISRRKVAAIFQDGAEFFPLSIAAVGWRGSCGYRRYFG